MEISNVLDIKYGIYEVAVRLYHNKKKSQYSSFSFNILALNKRNIKIAVKNLVCYAKQFYKTSSYHIIYIKFKGFVNNKDVIKKLDINFDIKYD